MAEMAMRTAAGIAKTCPVGITEVTYLRAPFFPTKLDLEK